MIFAMGPAAARCELPDRHRSILWPGDGHSESFTGVLHRSPTQGSTRCAIVFRVLKRTLAMLLAFGLLAIPVASAAAQTPLQKLEKRGAFWATSVTDADGGHPIREVRWLWLSFGSVSTIPERGKERHSHPVLFWEHTCNEHFYRVHVTRHRFLLKFEGSTAVGCSGDEDDWLEHFFDAGPHWRLRRGALILTAPTGRIVMRPNPHRDIRERFR